MNTSNQMNNESLAQELHHAGVTVRVLLFSISKQCLEVVLVKRDHEPYKGQPGLPGGYIQGDESLEAAARRIVEDLTGKTDIYIEQLYTFGDPERDANEYWVTVAYFALLPEDFDKKQMLKKHGAIVCLPMTDLPTLAYDHDKMIAYGLQRLKSKILYTNIAHGLLPEKFRLTDLQHVYEIILGKPLDKRNFRKKMLSLGLLKPVNERIVVGRHRPAMLYKFKTKDPIFFG